jgi:putative transposase
MSNTYSQIYIHAIFAVKGRHSFIQDEWKEDLFGYIGGVINNSGLKTLIVNGYRNHVHLLFELKPALRISDLIRDIKSNASKFLNEKNYIKGRFEWQDGYGAFSYSYSQINKVYEYIKNQEEHHRKKTFKEEYMEFLQKFNVEYNEKYLFDWNE